MSKHVGQAEDNRTLPMSNRLYDMLRALTQYVLPATGALYFALASIWGLPLAEQVLGTIAAVEIFIGAIIGVSKRSYDQSDEKYNGSLVVDESDEYRDIYRIELNEDPHEIKAKSDLNLKVEKTQTIDDVFEAGS